MPLTTANILQAFDQLSGVIHPMISAALINDIWFDRDWARRSYLRQFRAIAGAALKGAQLGFGASYTFPEVSTKRHVRFAGLNDRLNADYNTHTFQIFAEVQGKEIPG